MVEKSGLGSFPIKGFSPTYGALYQSGRTFGYGRPRATERDGDRPDEADQAGVPFVHLHVHSNFSFLDGGSRITELVSRAAELGQPALALTDHDGLYGAVRFARACAEAGIQPVFGAEVRVTSFLPDSPPPEHPYHLVLLAQTREGYANLCRLLSSAHLGVPDRDHPPVVTPEQLVAHHQGLLCLTGGREGEVGRLVDAGREDEARQALLALRSLFGPGQVVVEVAFAGWEPHRDVEAGRDGAPVYHKVRGEDGRLRHREEETGDQGSPDRRPTAQPTTPPVRPSPRPPDSLQNEDYAKPVAKPKGRASRRPALPPELPPDHPLRLTPADVDVGFHEDGSPWGLSCTAYADHLLRLARECRLLAAVTTDAHYAAPTDLALHLICRAAGQDEPLSGYPDQAALGTRCLRTHAELKDELAGVFAAHVGAPFILQFEYDAQSVVDGRGGACPARSTTVAAARAVLQRFLHRETATVPSGPADPIAAAGSSSPEPPLLPISPLDLPWLLARRCQVDLELGTYHFPQVHIPDGETAYSLLAKRCFRGIERRYRPVPPRALGLLEHELAMIEQLGFAHYFLVVHDIVRWARARGIAASGRGSAGNSLVCHVLDITASEPIKHHLLFERFMNPNRREMPDIDIDFCSARRDEVVEHIYRTFGQENVAVVANVNTMSPRMAVRVVAEAVGFTPTEINALAKHVPRHGDAGKIREYLAGGWPELADSPLQDEARYGRLLDLVERLDSYPLHLGTHLGGFVIADKPVTYYTPIQWAAKGVAVTQFNKDDVADLGLVKMDILGLRTHSAVMETVHLVRQRTGRRLEPYELEPDDPASYEIVSNGGSIGLFQLESAGQRNLATRLQEQTFDDIIAAIALYRPGPLEAEMITPFIDRRWGYEAVSLPHPSMAEALGDTYGVILYQEQVLRVAQLVAGFSPAEADSLRRAMTRDKSREEMHKIGETFVHHAVGRGVPEDAAREVFRQLEGFAAYGFNKSHSVCFAVISYATAYLKAHYPAEFLCAVLNNQPMGFYTPRTVLNDARRFGLDVRPLDINLSGRGFTVEDAEPPDPWAIDQSGAGYDPFALAWTAAHHYGLTRQDLDELEEIHGDAANLDGERSATIERIQALPYGGGGPGDPTDVRGAALPEAHVPADPVLPRAHRARARAGVMPGACLAPEGALAAGAGRALRVGLRYLKQMSERALQQIEQERRHGPFQSFEEFYLRTRVAVPVAENLIRVGAFDSLEPDRTELLWRLPLLHDRLDALSGSGGQRRGQLRAFHAPAQRAGLARTWSIQDKVRSELELLGLTVSCHPLQLYEGDLRRLGVTLSYELPALGDEVPVLVAGVYERAQNPWMRSGKRTMFLTLEDAYGLFECVVFESKLARCAPVVARATYFLVRGRLQNNRKRGLAIVAEEIHDLEEVLAKLEARQTQAIDAGATATRERAASSQRPARLGRPVERPTLVEQKLLNTERKLARGIREQEVYGPGTPDPRKRVPGAGTTAIPKKVG